MINALKKKFPQAKITVLARKRNVAVFEHPLVDRILMAEPYDALSLLREFRSFDFAIDCEPYLNLSSLAGFWLARQRIGFDHGVRSRLYTHAVPFNDQQHEVLTFLDMIRVFGTIKTPTHLVSLPVSQASKEKARNILSSIPHNKILVGLFAGAAESGRSRLWPADRFAAVSDKLIEEHNAHILLSGAPNETATNATIRNLSKHPDQITDITGKTSLREYFAVLAHCKLFISNDTGPMHVAAAQGVPTIGLFCPNTPVRFAPYGPKNKYIYKPVLATPCINVHKGEVPDCKTHNHMSRITPEDVLKEVRALLGNAS